MAQRFFKSKEDDQWYLYDSSFKVADLYNSIFDTSFIINYMDEGRVFISWGNGVDEKGDRAKCEQTRAVLVVDLVNDPIITPEPTATESPTPTNTAFPSLTATESSTPTEVPSATPSSTPTAIEVPSSTPSETPTEQPIMTPIPTKTITPKRIEVYLSRISK